jgi:hypothetical protein
MFKRSEATRITAEKVLKDIELIKLDAMQPIKLKDGTQSMLDRPSALKASELLGKHTALFTDKVEHVGKIGGKIVFEIINGGYSPQAD